MPPCDYSYPQVYLILHKCFNPCFSGCRPATSAIGGLYRLALDVSILVLVDAALRQYVS